MEKTRQSPSRKTLNHSGLGGTEGGRRPTGVPPNPQPAGEGISPPPADPNEVLEKPSRRHFTADYKLRILEQADRAQEPGTLGAVLRREGLYSSHLSTWRKQREQGILDGLARAAPTWPNGSFARRSPGSRSMPTASRCTATAGRR